jgi:AcrR family transcriptional regulator
MSEPVLSPTALKIIATAKRLFMQRGYRAVSVNDIVHQAEITKPTLYYHFTDKEELFVQMALHTLEAMHERMEQAVADRETTAERLAAIADVTLKSPDGNFRMMRHDIRENLSPAQQHRIALAFYQRMVDPLEREMARGLERGELTRHTPRELVWLFMGFLEGFHNDPAQADPETSTSGHNAFPTPMLIDLFLHGVGPSRLS